MTEDLRLVGTIIATHGKFYDVQFPSHVAKCYLSGKLDMHRIRCTVGDEIEAILSSFDLYRGRIVRRITK